MPEVSIRIHSSTEDSSYYTLHNWARQLLPALNVPLLYLSARGDYRINCALFSGEPNHVLFSDPKSKRLYQNSHWMGKTAQVIFRTPTDLASPDLQERWRQSGARLQGWAGYGLQTQWAGRLTVNLFTLSQSSWNSQSDVGLKNSIIVMDTLGLGGNLVDGACSASGRMRIAKGQEYKAMHWLKRSHQINQGASAFTLVSGALRLGLELQHYAKTGEMHSSTAIYGALDLAGGGIGLQYSRLVLKESRRLQNLAEKNTALLGKITLTPSVRFALRITGIFGSLVGFSASAYQAWNTLQNREESARSRKRQRNSSALGMLSSGFMLASACFVSPASAPVAGLLLATGLGLLTLQSLYDYAGN